VSAYVLARGDRFTVYHGDALDVLPTFETESVDLVVTDPPYGVEWQSNMRAETFEQLANDGPEDREGIRRAIGECVRLVGQHRHLYVFGPADVLEGHKVSEVAELVWSKGRPGMGDLAAPWAPAHERISFAVSKYRHAGQTGNPALPVRLRKGSVLEATPPTGRTVRHPSEKPVDLLRELIESSSRQGEMVLDPFAGVGSTGVAALLLGRHTIAVELNIDYAHIAASRFAEAEALHLKGTNT
jgi:site-specific DNA-methyltransferase (adenine-specific)